MRKELFLPIFIHNLLHIRVSLLHVLTKDARHPYGIQHVELQHQLDALERSVVEEIKEENARIINQDIHFQILLKAIVVELFSRMFVREVFIYRPYLNAILLNELRTHLFEFLLLIGNDNQVVALTGELTCIHEPDTRRGSGYKC